jgi:hypothetical protein
MEKETKEVEEIKSSTKQKIIFTLLIIFLSILLVFGIPKTFSTIWNFPGKILDERIQVLILENEAKDFENNKEYYSKIDTVLEMHKLLSSDPIFCSGFTGECENYYSAKHVMNI